MKVLYVSQSGSGIAEEVDLPESATVEALLALKGHGAEATSNFTVTINRQDASQGQRLNNGDLVVVTAKKYGGAR